VILKHKDRNIKGLWSWNHYLRGTCRHPCGRTMWCDRSLLHFCDCRKCMYLGLNNPKKIFTTFEVRDVHVRPRTDNRFLNCSPLSGSKRTGDMVQLKQITRNASLVPRLLAFYPRSGLRSSLVPRPKKAPGSFACPSGTCCQTSIAAENPTFEIDRFPARRIVPMPC
jgi:hypothetical protein